MDGKCYLIMFINSLLACVIVFSSIRLFKMYKLQSAIKRIKFTWIENFLFEFNIRYIETTTLKRYIPFINLNRLLLILLIIFSWIFFSSYRNSSSIILSLVLAIVVMFCPLILLDTLRYYHFQKTREEIMNIISLFSQWYVVTEDIFKCFEKATEYKLAEPMATYIQDFTIQIHGGLDTSEAFERLDKKVGSEFFSIFLFNMEQALHNRGDVALLLKNLEDEGYRLKEEFNRRKISTVHDKLIIYITMIVVLIIGHYFLVMNGVTEQFYFRTVFGRLLLMIFCVFYIVGFLITIKISRLEY